MSIYVFVTFFLTNKQDIKKTWTVFQKTFGISDCIKLKLFFYIHSDMCYVIFFSSYVKRMTMLHLMLYSIFVILYIDYTWFENKHMLNFIK